MVGGGELARLLSLCGSFPFQGRREASLWHTWSPTQLARKPAPQKSPGWARLDW